MRYTITTIGLCLFIAAPGRALTFMGPPATDLKAGQIEAGGHYTRSENDVEVEGFDMPEIEADAVLATIGIGLVSDRVEFVARGGIAEGEIDNLDSDWESMGGVGGRITMAMDDELSWGVVGQVMWASFENRVVDVDSREIQIAAGPSWHPSGLRVYGGVLVHFIDGDVTIPLTDDGFLEIELDFEEEARIGGYIGGALELWDHLAIGVEYQQTADSKAIGAGAVWRF